MYLCLRTHRTPICSLIYSMDVKVYTAVHQRKHRFENDVIIAPQKTLTETE